jgi:hypothetical protein
VDFKKISPLSRTSNAAVGSPSCRHRIAPDFIVKLSSLGQTVLEIWHLKVSDKTFRTTQNINAGGQVERVNMRNENLVPKWCAAQARSRRIVRKSKEIDGKALFFLYDEFIPLHCGAWRWVFEPNKLCRILLL